MKKTKNEKTTEKKNVKAKKPRKAKKAEEPKKPKMTLAEKQAIKLERQRAKDAEKAARGETEPKNKERFYCTNKELQAELMRWRDSNPAITERELSEELGKMLLAIGNKLLNHSSFRNYTRELKDDMLMFGIEKTIKGLKNYNFQFNNPFAWVTQAFYNAYLSVLNRHYKQINIKKDLMSKLSMELETYTGISPTSSLNRCIKSYLGNDSGED